MSNTQVEDGDTCHNSLMHTYNTQIPYSSYTYRFELYSTLLNTTQHILVTHFKHTPPHAHPSSPTHSYLYYICGNHEKISVAYFVSLKPILYTPPESYKWSIEKRVLYIVRSITMYLYKILIVSAKVCLVQSRKLEGVACVRLCVLPVIILLRFD